MNRDKWLSSVEIAKKANTTTTNVRTHLLRQRINFGNFDMNQIIRLDDGVGVGPSKIPRRVNMWKLKNKAVENMKRRLEKVYEE